MINRFPLPLIFSLAALGNGCGPASQPPTSPQPAVASTTPSEAPKESAPLSEVNTPEESEPEAREVVVSDLAAGQSLYWPIAGTCMRVEVGDDGRLRGMDDGERARWTAKYKLKDGALTISSVNLRPPMYRPLGAYCRGTSNIAATTADWIEFDGGAALARREGICQERRAPLPCLTGLVTDVRTAYPGPEDKLSRIIRRGGSVYLPSKEGCRRWRFQTKRGRLTSRGVYYQFRYESSVKHARITLSGPHGDGIGMGGYDTYLVGHTDAEFARVGGDIWYFSEARCVRSSNAAAE